MTDYVKIELTGRDGSYWCLAGPGAGQQGITISPNIQNFIDAPVKTLWVPGPFGQQYAGKRVQRREMVFAVQIYDDDPDTWATIDSQWRWAWDYDEEATLSVTTSDGTRSIGLRLLEAPKPYYDKDPHITADNPVVMTTAAEFPYWVEKPDQFDLTTVNTDFTWKPFVQNNGDIPVWLRWTLTDQALWKLPDFSWGNDMYSRGQTDLGRTVYLPELVEGENVVVDSDPRVQTIVAANDNPVQHRWKGQDLLYPLMPGKSGNIPVTVSNAPFGAAARLTVPKWFSRPWSRPHVVRVPS
ncbi:hypothetical protein A5747_13325 [Mycobacterium sp. IS-836]|uniref:hypothetical protein n=1 Tax=Mycobacterium sp. IS-836 TaxID=1834160 RepID=UPI00096D8899|nr:hypothetical protein [Mycobacterium sp. IS-836]OMC55368.1 hypothetical protein A5747_13325 [Mycobacterium sp. IS-836]